MAACCGLEDARRQFQIARHTHRRTLAQVVDDVAQALADKALIALPCFDEVEPPAGT